MVSFLQVLPTKSCQTITSPLTCSIPLPFILLDIMTLTIFGEDKISWGSSTPGMSNTRPAGRMRSFASTPAARTKDAVIWSFNDQNCSFYNLNWIYVRRSQKNTMLFFIQNVFYTWKYDRLFPSVKNILNKENSTAMQWADNVMSIFRSWACLSLWDLIEKRCQTSRQNTKNDWIVINKCSFWTV